MVTARRTRDGRPLEPVRRHDGWYRWCGIVLLTIHAGLLAWNAYVHSPNFDETAHLPAGISHWTFGRFDLYRVNPPLVRMVAALPILCTPARVDWTLFQDHPGARSEFIIGREFVRANGRSVFWYFTLARWMCIPLVILGALVCRKWATELHGSAAGMVALALWCFSPSVLGHGATINPDIAAASLGVAAAYTFWRWLNAPTYRLAAVSGVVLGAAELAKYTWIVLFPLCPLLWIMARVYDSLSGRRPDWWREGRMNVLHLGIALGVINAAYGFEGWLQRLGDYEFLSAPLSGIKHSEESHGFDTGNRFRGTMLAAVPIPLPKNYVLGIDTQKRDIDNGRWCYLRGEWRFGGWWYYYIYALLIKEPVAYTLLLAYGLTMSIAGRCRPHGRAGDLMLLAPALSVLALVSSQTSLNHHLRYVFPCLPFLYVYAGRAAAPERHAPPWRKYLVAGIMAWGVTSSLAVYPHSMSYFNELAGGPEGGPRQLAGSNTDWGQDLLYLRQWVLEHPSARPLYVAFQNNFDPIDLGIDAKAPPAGRQEIGEARPAHRIGPIPGWHIVSVNDLVRRDGDYRYFERFKRIDRIGYTMPVYHITLADANRVRKDLGVPPLPADEPTGD